MESLSIQCGMWELNFPILLNSLFLMVVEERTWLSLKSNFSEKNLLSASFDEIFSYVNSDLVLSGNFLQQQISITNN